MIFIVSKISAPQARTFDFSQKNRASGRDIFKTMKSRARSCPHRPLCGASGGIRHRRNRHMHPFRDGRIVDLSDNRLVPAGISCHLDRPLDRPMGAPCLQPFGIAQRSVEIAAELILCPRIGGASALSVRPVPRRRVDRCEIKAVFLQPLQDCGRRFVVGKQDLDGVELAASAAAKRSRTGNAANSKVRLATKRGSQGSSAEGITVKN